MRLSGLQISTIFICLYCCHIKAAGPWALHTLQLVEGVAEAKKSYSSDMWCHTSDNMANSQIQHVPASKSDIPCSLCETASCSSHKYLFSCLVNWDKFHSYLGLVQDKPPRRKMWLRLNLKTWQIWAGEQVIRVQTQTRAVVSLNQ